MTTLLIGFPTAWQADVEYTFTDLVEPTANGASFTKFPALSISPCVTYQDVVYYVPDPDTLPTEGDTPDTDAAWAVLGTTTALGTAASLNITNISHVAAVAPVATNDETEGYFVGSLWTDNVTGYTYTCTDATEGAAVWTQHAVAP